MSNGLFSGVNEDCYQCVSVLKNHSQDLNVGDALVSMAQTHSNRMAFVNRGQEGLNFSHVFLDKGQVKHQGIDSVVDFNHSNARSLNSLTSSFVVTSDALITDLSDVAISVKTADCLPVFVMGGGYISVIHAGREGTLKHISQHVCELFQAFGVAKIDVWFGPCACVSCYEIDQETATHFDLVNDNVSQIVSVYHEDAHFINGAGHEYCTQCHHEMLYSYRMGDTVDRNVFYLKKNN